MSGPATIRRGSTARRRARPTRRRGVAAARDRTPARMRQALVRLPIAAEQMRRTSRMLAASLLAVGAIVALVVLQVPQMIGNAARRGGRQGRLRRPLDRDQGHQAYGPAAGL